MRLEYRVFTSCAAGTAGNVLASRLTEQHKYSVLVIEAGVTYATFHAMVPRGVIY